MTGRHFIGNVLCRKVCRIRTGPYSLDVYGYGIGFSAVRGETEIDISLRQVARQGTNIGLVQPDEFTLRHGA